MKRPEFFIVGAPKSGTTFLHDRLGQHPDIFVPWMKEPHFFGSDLRLMRRRISEGEYMSLFAEAGPHQVVGEASVWYLTSRLAAREIHGFAPHGRIIVMLRNPVDMIRSLHQQALFGADEDIRDLREAIEAERDRRAGHRIPRGVRNETALFYTEAATYTPQVQRYLDTFGADKVHIILFDDLERDPQSVFDGAVRFLGVSTSLQISPERVNVAQAPKNTVFQRALHRPPSAVSAVARAILTPRARIRLVRRLQRWNTRPIASTSLDTATRQWLGPMFEDDVRALSGVVGRDLSHWIQSWQG